MDCLADCCRCDVSSGLDLFLTALKKVVLAMALA